MQAIIRRTATKDKTYFRSLSLSAKTLDTVPRYIFAKIGDFASFHYLSRPGTPNPCLNTRQSTCHLYCTLISENQGLDKLRSVSNLRKISGSAKGLHPEKNSFEMNEFM